MPLTLLPVEGHLVLNHFPVVALIFGLTFYVVGVLRDQLWARVAGMWLLVTSGVTALPVVASGLISASVLGDSAWLDADAVRTHRLAGILAGLASLVAATVSAFGLLAARGGRQIRTEAVLGLPALALALTLWAMYLGGRLRHSELIQSSSAHAEDTSGRGASRR